MGRKKILERRLQRLIEKQKTLTQRALASQDVNEVRSINEQLVDVKADIQDTTDEIAELESDGDTGTDLEGAEPRQNEPFNMQTRGGNPLASYNIGMGMVEQREEGYGSMEYRMAFMSYVQRGTPIPEDIVSRARESFEKRAGGEPGRTVTTDIGAIIPETIMSEFIKNVSKVYGTIYAKVRKLNVMGGVKFPISNLKAKFKWITETEVSERQKAGDIKQFVTFEYNVGEIRVAQSLLSQVVSLQVFESEIVELMMEAYVEMMDKMIIEGTGEGQPLGITKDPRVTNVVELSEAEIGDWTAWKKKLFAKVPLSKRGRGEFLFPSSTVETYLTSMKDKNDRPIFKEATDGMIGNLAGSFFGRETILVEPDIVKDFDTAVAGDVVGVFWVPSDYAVNTNLQFGLKRWFDEEKNEWVNKGLTIVDGKILDTSGCYLIKKK